MWLPCCSFFFFFNDTATTEIYTLSLHDALPISLGHLASFRSSAADSWADAQNDPTMGRSEEHTSELQSQSNLVCRLLLEKKNHLSRRRARAGAADGRRRLPVRDHHALGERPAER